MTSTPQKDRTPLEQGGATPTRRPGAAPGDDPALHVEGLWKVFGPKAEGAESVRVTFDHKFTIPKDSSAMNFRAEGTLKVKTLSREAVEHLVKDDGAKIKTNPDGTASEMTFLATGVELWK